MPDVTPLAVWPHDLSDAQVQMIRAAKAELGIAYPMQIVPAVPGSPVRILCLGQVAPFFGEHVLVSPENVERYDSIKGALDCLLTAEQGDPRIFDEEMWLSAVMGCAVTLVDIEHPEPVNRQTGPRFV